MPWGYTKHPPPQRLMLRTSILVSNNTKLLLEVNIHRTICVGCQREFYETAVAFFVCAKVQRYEKSWSFQKGAKFSIKVSSVIQENFLQWWKCLISGLSNTVSICPMWLLDAWEKWLVELNNQILINLILISLYLNSHMWLVDTLLVSVILEHKGMDESEMGVE